MKEKLLTIRSRHSNRNGGGRLAGVAALGLFSLSFVACQSTGNPVALVAPVPAVGQHESDLPELATAQRGALHPEPLRFRNGGGMETELLAGNGLR